MKLSGMARIFIRTAAIMTAAFATIGAGSNWNATVAKTDGGHRLGNPDAKVKLIEFVSYTCSHCAHFEIEADGAMRLVYVAPGKLSVEVRHIIRDPVDLTAAMLTNCGPADKFFLNHTAILRSQSKWIKTLGNLGPAMQRRWQTGDFSARRRAIASDLGFYGVMSTRGYDRTQINKCLNDDAFANKLANQSEADADHFGIRGTPSFAIDGAVLTATHDWASLQPQLAARF